MKPTEIRLNADDMKCLERGGSIDVEIKDGDKITAVVTVAMEVTSKGFNQPTNSAVAENH